VAAAVAGAGKKGSAEGSNLLELGVDPCNVILDLDIQLFTLAIGDVAVLLLRPAVAAAKTATVWTLEDKGKVWVKGRGRGRGRGRNRGRGRRMGKGRGRGGRNSAIFTS